MTRKHFAALSTALRQQSPHLNQESCNSEAALRVWKADCRSVADALSQFNPNFDRERFLLACGF